MKTQRPLLHRFSLAALLIAGFCRPATAELTNLVSQTFESYSVTSLNNSTPVTMPDGWVRLQSRIRNPAETTPTRPSDSKVGEMQANTSEMVRYWMSPAITGNVGTLTFDALLFAPNPAAETNATVTLSVFLSETPSISYGSYSGNPSLTNLTLTATNWVTHTVVFDRYNVTNQYLVLARGEVDPGTYRVQVDDIVLQEAPSRIEPVSLGLVGGGSSRPSDEPLSFRLDVVQDGDVSSPSAELWYRYTGEEEFVSEAMTAVSGGYEATLPADGRSNVQLEYYAVLSYENQLGPASHDFPAEGEDQPLRVDLLPVGAHVSVEVAGGLSAVLSLVTNGVWHGAMDRQEGVLGATYWFEASVETWGASSPLAIPFQATPEAGLDLPSPAEPLERDVVFTFSESDPHAMTVEHGAYQGFENWTDPGQEWSLGTGAVVTNDAAAARSGTHAVLVAGGDGAYVQAPLPYGIREAGVWFRRMGDGESTVTITVETQVDGVWSPAGTWSGLPSDDYAFRSLSLHDSGASALRLHADAPALLDDITLTDLSTVGLSDAQVDPDPVMALLPSAFSVEVNPRGGALIQQVTLQYRFGDSGPFDHAVPLVEQGGVFQTVPPDQIGPAPDSDQDLDYVVTVDYENWDGTSLPSLTSATGTVHVIPYSAWGWNGLTVKEDLPAQLFLAANQTWRGAILITPDAPVVNPGFWFESALGDSWGDGSVTSLPAQGVAGADESFVLSKTLTNSVAFFFDEATRDYRIRLADYEPFDGDALQPGWSVTGMELDVDSGLQGTAARTLNANATVVSAPRLGVGTVGFWACMTNGASSSSYAVEVLVDEVWLEAGNGTVRGPFFRHHELEVDHNDATRVRVTFQAADVLLDEMVVTSTGPFVRMSSPTFNGAPASTGTVYSVAYAGEPALGITALAENGASDVVVRVMYSSDPGFPAPNSRTLIGSSSGGVFTNAMPALAIGTNHYYYVAEFSGAEAPLRFPEAPGSYFRYVTSSVLGNSRELDITGWGLANGTTYNGTYIWWNGTEWVQSPPAEQREFSWRIGGITPQGIFSGALPMDNTIGAYLRTPRQNGVGSIHFKAMPALSLNETHEITVQLSTNPLFTSGTTNVATIVVPVSSQYTAFRVEVNDYRSGLYVRLLRSTLSSDVNNKLVVRDLVVTPPPADVVLSEPSILHPGYPSRNEPITFYSTVINKSANYSAVDIQPKLVWRMGTNVLWNTSAMSLLSNDVYTVTLDPLDPGAYEYYVEVGFNGPSYRFTYNGVPYDENRSPSYLGWNGVADVNTLQTTRVLPAAGRPFRVRRFFSTHAGLDLQRFDTEIQPDATAMQLVGDHTWQAVLLLTNAVSMPLVFEGGRPYLSGATAYEAEGDLWGDDAQLVINPPLSGTATIGAVSNIVVEMSYIGFVMFRFNSLTGRYEVRRAAFQDFNSWQASDQYFQQSFGLYALQNYEADFEDVPLSGPVGIVGTDFNGASMNPAFDLPYGPTPPHAPVRYVDDWRIENAWIVQDRLGPTNANRALRIHAGVGTLQSTPELHTRGRDSFLFRHRVAFGDHFMPYYRNAFDWQNYRLQARITPTSISPANPTMSLIGYYQDPDNFYELRATQLRDLAYNNNAGRDNVQYALFRRKDGEYSSLATTTRTGVSLTNGVWEAGLTITNTTSGVALVGYAGFGTQTNILTFSDDSAGHLAAGGSVGFNVSDTVASFSNLQVLAAPGFTSSYGGFNPAQAANWFLGGRPVDGAAGTTRWTFNEAAVSLTRPLRPVSFDVRSVRTGDSTALPSQPAWNTVPGGALEAGSLGYVSVNLPIRTWDYTFLQIRPLASDGMLVVDDLSTRDWRGLTLTDPKDVPVNDPFTNTVWRATEAYVTLRSGSRMLELTRSRANPANRQMLVSPVLDDGVGTIFFNYQTSGGTADFVVERASFDGMTAADDPWEPVIPPESIPPGAVGDRSLFVGTNMNTRVRVRMLDSSDADATLWLDNVTVTSFPPVDNTSWGAYNALITRLESERAFEPNTSGAQTAFLNDSTTEDVYPLTPILDDHRPFIQSPEIGTGIGEIGFWYRAWDPEAEHPGKLKLMMAPTADSTNWVEVVLRDAETGEIAPEHHVYTNQLSTITSSEYEYFSIEIFDTDNKVLRIYAETNEASRVAIDNIIVTEPVRSSIDIHSVTLVPDIPLIGDPVHVEVLLENPRLSPTEIQVFLDYHVGTNLWGMATWTSDPELYTRVELEKDGDNDYLFRTPSGSPIPAQPVDEVVQYRVMVTYSGTFPAPVVFEQFENPFWYEPVNLNEQYADQGFSPHYFVFSCSTGVVFVSEFFYALATDSVNQNREFVEIMGPRNAPIGTWRVDVVDASFSQFSDHVRTSYTLPENAYLHSGENGWGFYVLGDTGEAISNRVDYFFPDGGNPAVSPPEDARLPASGGFRLVRSMGAYVDRVSYGTSEVASQNMVERGYTYTAYRGTLGTSTITQSIGLGEVDGELSWRLFLLSSHSPGEMNETLGPVIGEIDPYPEPGPDDPDIAELALEIQSIQLQSGQVTVTVLAWSENPEVTTDLTGWTAVLETNALPAEAGWGEVFETAEGLTVEGPYDFSVPEETAPVFFRIKATHPGAP